MRRSWAALTWLAARATAGRMVVHLRWTAPLLVAGSMLALLIWRPVSEMGESGRGGVALWLHLPCFFWSAAVLAAGLESWPTFGRGQNGADHLLRLRIGPLHGCGAASVAMLVVQGVGLAALGIVFAVTSGLGPARAHLSLPPVAPDQAVLTEQRPRVELRAPPEPVQELRLRPLAFARGEGSLRPTDIEVLSAGEPLHEEPLSVAGSGELHRVVFPPRRLGDLEVRAVGEVGLPLYFGQGSVVALSARTWPGLVNGVLACLTYAVPAAVSLSLVCLAGPWLGLVVASLLALAALFLTTAAGWVPTGEALQALATGRLAVDADILRNLLPSLSVAFLAIITAMWTRRRSTG